MFKMLYGSEFREPFSMDDFVSFLQNHREFSKEKMDRIMLRTMRNPDFMEHLFPTGKDTQADGLSEKMYALLIKKRIMKSICRVLEMEGPKTFNRSIATWLYSVATVAITTQEKRWKEYKEMYGDLNPRKEMARASDARMARENLEEYDAVCVSLVKLIRKIDKRDIKQMVIRANVPEGLAECVVVTVPEIKYVTNFRVGFYLNQVLLSIYRFVDDHHYNTSKIDWKEFFRILFGDKNVIEAATFILLEGVHRIDEYGDEVSDTFNQLTMFALKELEIAPEGLKTQMLDLYVKRISRMFANRTFDLRANLLDIDPMRFPNLAKTVDHYASQISEIVNRGINK